jgi:hypothetical protein
LENLQNSYQNLQSLKSQWEDLEQKTSIISSELSSLEKSSSSDLLQCDGLLSYESDSFGTGLTASYFPTASFSSTPILVSDENIDFEWNGQPPVSGVG